MVLRSAPWRRAPLLLLRTPGVFLACVVAMAALAVAASSGVLFLASAGTGALRDLAARECPQDAQPGITNDAGPTRLPTAAQATAALNGVDASVTAALRSHGLPAPDFVATAPAAVSADPTDTVTLFARSSARDHVHVLARGGTPGTGVYVPQSLAAARHLHVGSDLPVGAASATVTGIYRDLAPSAFRPEFALPRYWCAWSDAIVPTPSFRPPPLVLADRATVVAAGSVVTSTWFVPSNVDHSTAPQLRDALARTTRALATLRPAQDYGATTDLPFLLRKAQRERDGLGGAVVPINLAGTIATALLVAAAGAFWGLRRQREIRLLGSRGVGRVAIGVKAMLEIGPALLVGTVLGWLAAIGLVVMFGPAAQLEPGAPWTALRLAAWSGLGALLIVGLLGARALPSDAARNWRWLRRLPWEVALLAMSVLTYRSVRAAGSVQISGGTVKVNPLVLTFPLLALTGGVLLLARVGAIGLRLSRPTGHRLPVAGYLALRRLTGTPAVALGTVIGVALPLGVLIYSAALGGSTDSDVQRKYETNVGAPHAFGTLAEAGSTPQVGTSATIVSMLQIDTYLDGQNQIRVIGVDPATFPRFAFGGSGLVPELDRLATPGAGVAALLVNAPRGTAATTLTIRGAHLPIRVVGERASFPGERDPYEPLLVVDRADLPRHLPLNTDRTEELWTDSTHEVAALQALHAGDVDVNYEITPQSFLDSTGLQPVTWVFGYLRALAYLTGLIGVTALAFAFTARTRRTALSYHLARRMGLTRAGHRRSLAVEIGGLVALAWVIGIGLALAAVALVYELTDPYPNFPPPPVLPIPAATIATSAVIAAVAVLVATVVLQRVIDRLRPAELIRTA